tara:strand:+ start:380 stop:898 length:519 start_codon:yes stop_codon:yes gene_type:complete
MALNRITPGLTDTTLVTKKHKFYSDLDLNFTAKTGTVNADGVKRGDIFKKVDVAAVKQSITTILLTNKPEKPFDPKFGADLRAFLFEPMADYSESVVNDVVRSAIERYENRVEVVDVIFTDLGVDKVIPSGVSTLSFWNNDMDRYSLLITVVVRILNTNELVSIDVNMNRLR